MSCARGGGGRRSPSAGQRRFSHGARAERSRRRSRFARHRQGAAKWRDRASLCAGSPLPPPPAPGPPSLRESRLHSSGPAQLQPGFQPLPEGRGSTDRGGDSGEWQLPPLRFLKAVPDWRCRTQRGNPRFSKLLPCRSQVPKGAALKRNASGHFSEHGAVKLHLQRSIPRWLGG